MTIFIMFGLILSTLFSIYLYFYFYRIIKFFKKDNHIYYHIISIILALGLGFCCYNFANTITIIMLHIIVISLFVDLIYLIVKLILRKNNIDIKRSIKCIYTFGILPILMSSIFIIYGAINMTKIVETKYDITTNKNLDYKIVMISDTHYDTIQNPKILKTYVDKFSQMNLDLLILDGDIIDESTSKESIKEVFNILSNVKTKYGIYYVYGNHDRGNYGTSKVFTKEELDNYIRSCNINVLSDESVIINNQLLITGREDYKDKSINRKEIEDINKDIDTNNYYKIMLDHEPVEIEDVLNNNYDLMLSGHTHAGQIWPSGAFLRLIGRYNYGKYEIDDLTLLVSSGFTGWGYPIRTEKHCEYVLINLK